MNNLIAMLAESLFLINNKGLYCQNQYIYLYRLFDEKRLNPQLCYPLPDFNEQKNQRYGPSSATKHP
jgi:hypothetical protein